MYNKIFKILALLVLINVIPLSKSFSQGTNSAKIGSEPTIICKTNQEYCNQVKETFIKHSQSFENKDIDKFMSFLSKEKEVILLGSGNLQKHIGLENIENAVKKDFQSFDSFKKKPVWMFISGNEFTAWLIADITCSIKAKEQEQEIKGRQTVTFSKENGQWKVVNSHFSIPSKTGLE